MRDINCAILQTKRGIKGGYSKWWDSQDIMSPPWRRMVLGVRVQFINLWIVKYGTELFSLRFPNWHHYHLLCCPQSITFCTVTTISINNWVWCPILLKTNSSLSQLFENNLILYANNGKKFVDIFN